MPHASTANRDRRPAPAGRPDRRRPVVAVGLTAALVVAVAGTVSVACGRGDANKPAQAVPALAAVQSLAEAMARTENSTYTAEYVIADGSTVVVAQSPPHRAYRGPSTAYVLGPDAAYLCRSATTGSAAPLNAQPASWPRREPTPIASSPAPSASGPPAPSSPAPTQPSPSSPAPTQPSPSSPAPTQPSPSSPAPTQPGPSSPAPTQPGASQAISSPRPAPHRTAPPAAAPPTSSPRPGSQHAPTRGPGSSPGGSQPGGSQPGGSQPGGSQPGGGATSCERAPGADGLPLAHAKVVAPAFGNRFTAPEYAMALLARTATLPNAQAGRSERSVAGIAATCVVVRAQGRRDASACANAAGIMVLFDGTGDSGTPIRMELRRLTATAAPDAFDLPDGASITDVTALR